MGLRRSARCAAVVCGSAAALLALVHCKDPTQIIIEVHSDDCPSVKDTGIAIAPNVTEVASKEPDALAGHPGCEQGDRIGTLTIYPTGSKDEEIAFKVVTAEAGSAGACQQNGNKGCIVQTRTTSFIPGTTHRVLVMMSSQCLNLDCGPEKTCIAGKCYSTTDIGQDGGTTPDATASDANVVDGTALDVDAGDPNCVGCAGVCDGKTCKVTCNTASKCTGSVCSPKLPCTIDCKDGNACANVTCVTADECSIHCSKGNACDGVSCVSATCEIDCSVDNACIGQGASLTATGNAKLVCNGRLACGAAQCHGGDCSLTCQGGDGSHPPCPQVRPCTSTVVGGCDTWNNPN